MLSNCTYELYYDPDNKQIEHMYIAKKLDENKEVIGYLVIEKPYYGSNSYWIYTNEYIRDLNYIKQYLIDSTTLRPYTQSEEVKYRLKEANVELKKELWIGSEEEPESNKVIFLEQGSKLPLELWNLKEEINGWKRTL